MFFFECTLRFLNLLTSIVFLINTSDNLNAEKMHESREAFYDQRFVEERDRCIYLCQNRADACVLVYTNVIMASIASLQASVQPLPGARIARMKNANCTKADILIVHAGTCNMKNESDPEELAIEIVSTLNLIQTSCNTTQIAFSGIIKRKDDLELNAKAIKTNELVVEKLMYSGFDFIDNNQIKYGNISRDGLHINDGGVKKLASNFSHYIRLLGSNGKR